MATKRRKVRKTKKSCKNGKLKRPVRTNKRGKRRYKKRSIRKYNMNNKKGILDGIFVFISDIFNFLRLGNSYSILKSIVDPYPTVLMGDIIVYENFGGPPFLRIQHSAICIEDGNYCDYEGKKYITIKGASCGGSSGCINYKEDYIVNPKKSNKYLWIIRYNGPNALLYREIAAMTAKGWGNTKQIKYKKIHELPSAFSRAKFLPCYSTEADQESFEIYSKSRSKSIPVKKGGEKVNMICSKFVLGAWMKALSNDKQNLDNCLPVKPSNCSPGDILKLGNKPCWEVVGKINVKRSYKSCVNY